MNSVRNYLLLLFASAMIFSCKPKQKFALIETDYGNMKVVLFDSTPAHRDNFVKLVGEGFYDDLLFHRVMQGFMIQGGDPVSRDAAPQQRLGAGGPGYTLDAEINEYHFKGRLAAARQPDQVNPDKKSSGSQFYIVQGGPVPPQQLAMFSQQKGLPYSDEDQKRYGEMGGTPFLDKEYTVFGEVVEEMEVIDKIAAVKTSPGDRPVQDVKMKIRMVK